jgi:hypothetical protein
MSSFGSAHDGTSSDATEISSSLLDFLVNYDKIVIHLV